MDGSKWKQLLSLVIIGVLAAGSASAHDVWITTEQDGDGNVYALVHHGHPGDPKNPDADKLFHFIVEGNRGSSQSLLSGIKQTLHGGIPVLKTASMALAGETGIVILEANYDNGYWVKTADGHRNTSRRQIPDAEDSLYSMKFAKAMVQTSPTTADSYRRVVGHQLELVPLMNPFSVQPGNSLKVRVYFDGKPLVGVDVERGDGISPMAEKDIPRYKTDAEGVATIPITKLGPQLLVVDHILPSTHQDLAAHELYNATLSFVLTTMSPGK
ncbi:MAG: DUF4198 domain-containing protein [Nitrospiraceae bacterium]